MSNPGFVVAANELGPGVLSGLTVRAFDVGLAVALPEEAAGAAGEFPCETVGNTQGFSDPGLDAGEGATSAGASPGAGGPGTEAGEGITVPIVGAARVGGLSGLAAELVGVLKPSSVVPSSLVVAGALERG